MNEYSKNESHNETIEECNVRNNKSTQTLFFAAKFSSLTHGKLIRIHETLFAK